MLNLTELKNEVDNASQAENCLEGHKEAWIGEISNLVCHC